MLLFRSEGAATSNRTLQTPAHAQQSLSTVVSSRTSPTERDMGGRGRGAILRHVLRSKVRRKDGKEHRAWSVVENRRVHDGRVVQWQVLYLGEINDGQRVAWSKPIEVFDEGAGQSKRIALFPEDRLAPVLDCDVVSIRLSAIRLRRPRQWGACWMANLLWDQLRLDEFWLTVEPVSAPPKWKLENRAQRPAPEILPARTEIPKITDQRLGRASLTRVPSVRGRESG